MGRFFLWIHSIHSTTPTLLIAFILLLATMVPSTLHGQQSSTAPTVPQHQPSQQPDAQPGEGAQVRTGAVIGNDADTTQRVLNLISDHQFARLEAMLTDADSGKTTLSDEQQKFVRGILDNRENKPQQSIQLLAPLVDQIARTGNLTEEKLARKALAEDYLRSGDLTHAAAAYQAYSVRLAETLTPDDKDEIEMPLKLLPLASANPPMTVEYGQPFSLPYDLDPLGLTDIPVFVDAQSHDWMLDPTSPFNLICRSTAREVGLRLSAQSATIHTLTGRPIVVHSTVIPRMTLGNVTFRNVAAFVFNDEDYSFPRSGYQVRGVLGYPAVSALGNLTITANAQIRVQPGPKGARLTDGAPFYLDGNQILVALGDANHPRMYAVDAGGQQSYLTSRFYSEHARAFAKLKMQLLSLPGASNLPPAPAYVASAVSLEIGSTRAIFQDLQVLTQPLGASATDDTYGTLGVDALEQLKSYTFDYQTMQFAVTTR
uniref:Uncharacterized protein n=1 Tax=mine drainage metagenome TaxID=410659 RepID=E6PZC7_9ZZZZ